MISIVNFVLRVNYEYGYGKSQYRYQTFSADKKQN